MHLIHKRGASPVGNVYCIAALGLIRLDNAPDPAQSTETHYLYNLNENLITYSAASATSDIIAPDSIWY